MRSIIGVSLPHPLRISRHVESIIERSRDMVARPFGTEAAEYLPRLFADRVHVVGSLLAIAGVLGIVARIRHDAGGHVYVVRALKPHVGHVFVIVVYMAFVDALETREVGPAARQHTVLVKRAVGSLGNVALIIPVGDCVEVGVAGRGKRSGSPSGGASAMASRILASPPNFSSTGKSCGETAVKNRRCSSPLNTSQPSRLPTLSTPS